MDIIRKTKCSQCSCMSAMKEIHHFKETPPKNDQEAMCLDEILDYWCLEWELFQCYMDANGTKCKWLKEYVDFLKNNGKVEEMMINNLQKYKDEKRTERSNDRKY